MQVFCLSSLAELTPYADDWDRLSAGVPSRSWAWLSTWWRHYGHPGARLFVLSVFDDSNTLVGLGPWYRDHSASQGRVVRMLGCGEVCSDYLSVLCQPGTEDPVTRAMAQRLAEYANADAHDPQRWDLMELTGIDAEDRAAGRLLDHLGEWGAAVHRQTAPSCWRIELPTTWDDYLAMLSKSHRKQLRRLQRDVLATDRAVLHSVEKLDDLPEAVELLIDLHQRRRRGLGEPGCFASRRFAAFHRDVMPLLLRNGQLELHWLELDGRAVAADYDLVGNGVVYAYQAGVDPERLDQHPGRLITLATLRRAIQRGYRAFDLLRGDEPYKAHFRARPRPGLAVRVVPNRTSAQLRHGFWQAGENVKQWIKSGLKLVGTQPCRSGSNSC